MRSASPVCGSDASDQPFSTYKAPWVWWSFVELEREAWRRVHVKKITSQRDRRSFGYLMSEDSFSIQTLLFGTILFSTDNSLRAQVWAPTYIKNVLRMKVLPNAFSYETSFWSIVNHLPSHVAVFNVIVLRFLGDSLQRQIESWESNISALYVGGTLSIIESFITGALSQTTNSWCWWTWSIFGIFPPIPTCVRVHCIKRIFVYGRRCCIERKSIARQGKNFTAIAATEGRNQRVRRTRKSEWKAEERPSEIEGDDQIVEMPEKTGLRMRCLYGNQESNGGDHLRHCCTATRFCHKEGAADRVCFSWRSQTVHNFAWSFFETKIRLRKASSLSFTMVLRIISS